jgi:peptide/nickel transport system permease protein
MATVHTGAAPALTVETRRTRRAARRWLRNRNLLIGLGMIGALALVALFAPVLTPYQPLAQDYASTLRPPSLQHPFSTDSFGRDVLTRIIYGARIDLRVGLTAVLAPSSSGSRWAASPAISAAGSTRSSCAASTSCRRSPSSC